MGEESQYGDQSSASYWVGVHLPHSGTIATAPVTEDDVRRLDMLQHVAHLPLTEPAYRRLPDEERDRISIDDGVALQTYREFMDRYEAKPDQFNAAVKELLPVHVVTGQLDETPYTVSRYLTEEGRDLLADEADVPDQYEWGAFVDDTEFTTKADVLYGQTEEAVERAEPGWALINLKFAKWNEHLRGWRDNMDPSAEHTESLAEHTESWAEAQERTIEKLEQINETLEDLPEETF